MEPVSGQKLGRYTLARRLGAGGMAEVWEATDDLLRRRVAVKIVRGALAESPEFSSRFLREARLAAQLQHSGVVAVYDVGLERHALFVVMPVLSGGSLADRLARPVDDATALAWLATLASALDYAHGKGVVHRDVKPLNVLFDDAGAPHLSDFGLAKGLDEATHLTQTGMILGTPLYMSPEQAMGSPAGPPADQYSLGVVAYRLLAGRLPFEKEPTPVLLRRTVFEEMPPPSSIRPGLPPSVDAVFARVLAKSPEGRFPSCAAFIDALAKALSPRGGTRTARLETDATKPEPVRPLLRPHEASTPPRPAAERRTPPPLPLPTVHGTLPGPGAPRPRAKPPRRVPAGALLLGGAFALLLGVSLWIVLRPREAPPPFPSIPTPAPAAIPSPTATATATPTQVATAPSALLSIDRASPAAAETPRRPAPPTPTPSPTRTPTPSPTPSPSPSRTSTPSPTPTPSPAPTSTARPSPAPPATATAARPSPVPARPTAPADPLADVPRRFYAPDMRLKDAWVEVVKGGSYTLVFKFTDDLEGRGESIGTFAAISVPTRGDVPLLPGARVPIRLLCKGLDASKVQCMVPPPADAFTLQAPHLTEGDRVSVRAVLAGFSFSATLRVED
ncbi:MAG: serine/threonine-protein kinase [Thermoanaerobaculia bacterium]